MNFFKAVTFVLFLFVIGYSLYIFIISLNEDSYIHHLKNIYLNENNEDGLIGVSGKINSNEVLISKYENHSVVYYEVERQHQVCRQSSGGRGRNCNWETRNLEINSVPFNINVNGQIINIKEDELLSFNILKDENQYTTYINNDVRENQRKIDASSIIYVFGKVEENELKMYDDLKHSKKTFYVTDDLNLFFNMKINTVLFAQFFSLAPIFLCFLIIYSINKCKQTHSFKVI